MLPPLQSGPGYGDPSYSGVPPYGYPAGFNPALVGATTAPYGSGGFYGGGGMF